jgi:hypothetical protein
MMVFSTFSMLSGLDLGCPSAGEEQPHVRPESKIDDHTLQDCN